MFAGLGMIALASFFISAMVYRRMAKRSSKVAMAMGVLLFILGIFLIGFMVLWYLAA